jgi:hypothetical protein
MRRVEQIAGRDAEAAPGSGQPDTEVLDGVTQVAMVFPSP